MGYSTDFDGILKFKSTITGEQLAYLKSFLGKDRRDIGLDGDEVYQNGKYGDYWYHIDYKISDDFSGIEHDGSEKSYQMEHIANFIIDKMKGKHPYFGLTGQLLAQGEEYDDRWFLRIVEDRAVKVDIPMLGDKVSCPHCKVEFVLEEPKSQTNDIH